MLRGDVDVVGNGELAPQDFPMTPGATQDDRGEQVVLQRVGHAGSVRDDSTIGHIDSIDK